MVWRAASYGHGQHPRGLGAERSAAVPEVGWLTISRGPWQRRRGPVAERAAAVPGRGTKRGVARFPVVAGGKHAERTAAVPNKGRHAASGGSGRRPESRVLSALRPSRRGTTNSFARTRATPSLGARCRVRCGRPRRGQQAASRGHVRRNCGRMKSASRRPFPWWEFTRLRADQGGGSEGRVRHVLRLEPPQDGAQRRADPGSISVVWVPSTPRSARRTMARCVARTGRRTRGPRTWRTAAVPSVGGTRLIANPGGAPAGRVTSVPQPLTS